MLLSDIKKEFIFNCQIRKLSKKTCSNYDKQIQYLLNYLLEEYKISIITDVEALHIKRFIEVMDNNGRKPSYLNDLIKAFKVFFKYAYVEGYIDEIITDKVKNVKEPKVIINTYTENEMKQLIGVYHKRDYLSIRNKVILCTLFDTGIRANELMSMNINQLREDSILIYGKGGKSRVVPKSPFLAKWLFKYLTVRESYFQYKGVTDLVFPSRNGKKLTHESLATIIRSAGEIVGVSKDIRQSPHTIRHSYAQMQLRHGMDLYTLSRLLGHENISITQRYLEGVKDEQVVADGIKNSPLMNM